MKDYIIKTTRCMRAEWNSQNILYSLRKGFQVVYLFDCIKTPVVDELPDELRAYIEKAYVVLIHSA